VHETITVRYDDDCGLCSASVRFMSARTDATVSYRPNRDLDSPSTAADVEDAIVVTAGGQRWTAVDAVAMVLGRSGRLGRMLARMLRLPGVHGLAGILYRAVALNRGWISARLGLAAGCEFP
jgi:predicted DCC family thiol-disulfide oxidoreductase YuxK